MSVPGNAASVAMGKGQEYIGLDGGRQALAIAFVHLPKLLAFQRILMR